jgi:peptidoglycan/xylan/chitin deacetylase (PgdA/CDA1 family)
VEFLSFSSVKLWIKWLLAGMLYYSGILYVYSKLLYRQQGMILTYHRIINLDNPDEFTQPGMYVRPHTFEKHLYYLKRRYQVVTMKELLSWCEHPKRTNRPLCVISFDDGWSDNYSLATPLLQKYRFPAILFVSTDFITSGQAPWFYEIGNILYHLAKAPCGVGKTLRVEAGIEIPEILWNWFEAPRMFRLHQIDVVLESLKGQSRDELELIGKWLYGVLVTIGQRPPGHEHVMLDWQQVKEIHQGGIEIGSHSLSHAILTRVSQDTIQTEVYESKRRIEAQLQQEVQGFCYPNGEYNEEVERFVRGAGYRFACTTEVGYIEPHANVYRLKRIGVHEDITFSTPLFACHVMGIFF